MLAALYGISLDADETQQTRQRRADPLAEHLGIVQNFLRRRCKGLEDGDGNARVASRRIDHHIGGIAELLNPLAALAPISQAFLPHLGLLRCIVSRREPLLARIVLIDPGREILATELRKRQHQVRQIPLGIDDQRRDTVDRRFFEQTDAKAGLAASGHADANGVSD